MGYLKLRVSIMRLDGDGKNSFRPQGDSPHRRLCVIDTVPGNKAPANSLQGLSHRRVNHDGPERFGLT